jgi:4-carboxymuconolactone decarboxylase
MSGDEMLERGSRTRREVLGADYVDASLAQADDFLMAFQRLSTEWAWDYVWNRPGLDRRTRSLLNLAMQGGAPARLGPLRAPRGPRGLPRGA